MKLFKALLVLILLSIGSLSIVWVLGFIDSGTTIILGQKVFIVLCILFAIAGVIGLLTGKTQSKKETQNKKDQNGPEF